MSDYTEFFLSTPSAVVMLDCIKVSHPSFTQDYYIVRNAARGVTVVHEDATPQEYQFYPLKVEPLGFRDNLDQGFSITIGDTGDTLPTELDRIYEDDAFDVHPTFEYRAYRSDVLNEVLYGPVHLVIEKITMSEEGAVFEAKAPSLNDGRTGELYRLDRFPMLRGLL